MNARQRRVYRRKLARRIETWNEVFARLERQSRVYDYAFKYSQQFIINQVRAQHGLEWTVDDLVAALRAAYPDVNPYYEWSQSNGQAHLPAV
jgi:hypothetical protein